MNVDNVDLEFLRIWNECYEFMCDQDPCFIGRGLFAQFFNLYLVNFRE